MKKKFYYLLLLLFFLHPALYADDGYRLWLRYDKIDSKSLLADYDQQISSLLTEGNSPVIISAKDELNRALKTMLDKPVILTASVRSNGCIIIGTPKTSPLIASLKLTTLKQLHDDGFTLISTVVQGKQCIVITANTEVGVLYGTFHFLQLLQAHQSIRDLHIISSPAIKLRILDHWDNLNGKVERGYAGFSIWKWHLLPDYIDPRYKDYARANASIGINGAVLNNVNASAASLTKEYLIKAAALADIFRAYGIKVYLSAKFSAPIEIGGLSTADPLNTQVKEWWRKKVDTIYQYIPDFGGFLVKANSEGQPGPQDYKRSHADGANMLADALAPHHGIVMWRAFVYSQEASDDRFKQAYDEFKPLDGTFRKNVLVQVKNGPIDFQPREPFHPLFGAMPHTPLMMEFQLTQEYLGQGTQLVYEAPLFKECLQSDTYSKGKGSIVAKVIDGSLDYHSLSGMAGVANIGDDRNWCGHPFAQANWYAFGRLAWDPSFSAANIADEWIRMTFTNNQLFVDKIKNRMLNSREVMVDYMTPFGLHHIMGYGHHYGPAPWYDKGSRADWNPVYYHKADSNGVGFDRTATGSNALAQYTPQVQKLYNNIETCPEEYLLWFHHVPWNFKMKSGKTFWEELCNRYYAGVDSVKRMQQDWLSIKGQIDDERFEQVRMLLTIQQKEAVWWRNACLLYFQTFSKMALPKEVEQPDQTLEYYKNLKFPFAP
jgi:alpha-glucuronidase